ncbi:hypothetical protein [Brevundimonas sp.]|nr:hypothetical protein [Brevundimonas sp.]
MVMVPRACCSVIWRPRASQVMQVAVVVPHRGVGAGAAWLA